MNSSQACKQQQQCTRQGHTESSGNLFALTATARFQANTIDQPSLRDMLLRGNSVFTLITPPPFRNINQYRVVDNGGGGDLLNLMRVLDDALLVCTEPIDLGSNGPEPCTTSEPQLDQ